VARTYPVACSGVRQRNFDYLSIPLYNLLIMRHCTAYLCMINTSLTFNIPYSQWFIRPNQSFKNTEFQSISFVMISKISHYGTYKLFDVNYIRRLDNIILFVSTTVEPILVHIFDRKKAKIISKVNNYLIIKNKHTSII
jgi:hypothetical protein